MVNPDNWALDFGLYFHLSPGCSNGMLVGVCSWVGKSPPKNAYKYNMEYCLWCSANDVLYGYITYIHMINYRCDGCKYICLCSLHAWIHMSLKSSPCKCSPTASSSFENGRSAVPFDRSLLDSDLASVGLRGSVAKWAGKTLEFSASVKTTSNKNCFPIHEMLKMFNIWLVHMTKDHKNDEISKAGKTFHPQVSLTSKFKKKHD